jgi:hypothetical protein
LHPERKCFISLKIKDLLRKRKGWKFNKWAFQCKITAFILLFSWDGTNLWLSQNHLVTLFQTLPIYCSVSNHRKGVESVTMNEVIIELTLIW